MNLAEIEAKNEGPNRPWGTLAQGDIRILVARVKELEWALRCMLRVFGQDGLGDGAEGDAVCIALACFPDDAVGDAVHQ